MITYVMVGLNLRMSFAAIVFALILLFPMIMRWSRNIWINLFIKYNPDKILKKD